MTELPSHGAESVALPVGRRTSTTVARSRRCRPLFDVYLQAQANQARSWNQIEPQFLQAMRAFDDDVASTAGRTDMTDAEKSQLGADLQNGKGDFFNDLLALLLENCAGVETLYIRNLVPGLIVRTHNLDGVYPASGPIEFLLEAKMTGTPRHVNSPKQKPAGRPGSADLDKRVKELAFKSIDLRASTAGYAPPKGMRTERPDPAAATLRRGCAAPTRRSTSSSPPE